MASDGPNPSEGVLTRAAKSCRLAVREPVVKLPTEGGIGRADFDCEIRITTDQGYEYG